MKRLFNYIKIFYISLIIISYIYIKLKYALVYCEDKSDIVLTLSRDLELLKKELLVDLFKHVIYDENFINDFGRNKRNNHLITLYYSYVISTEAFVKKFLDRFITFEFFIENINETKETIYKKIVLLFLVYVKDQQQIAEENLLNIYMLIFGKLFLISMIKNYFPGFNVIKDNNKMDLIKFLKIIITFFSEK